MEPVEKVQQRLMHYMRSFGSVPGRVFTLRDFNTQVMMNSFAPEDRVLDAALAGMVEGKVLERRSPTEYVLLDPAYLRDTDEVADQTKGRAGRS